MYRTLHRLSMCACMHTRACTVQVALDALQKLAKFLADRTKGKAFLAIKPETMDYFARYGKYVRAHSRYGDGYDGYDENSSSSA